MSIHLTDRELRRLRRAESAALRQADRVIDLDDPGVERLGLDPSSLPGSVAPDQHVHDMLRLRIGPNYYLGKSEDVLVPLDWRYAIDFRSFYSFACSLFVEGEGETPLRRLDFPDDPEIPPVTFHRHRILRDPLSLRALEDDHAPGDIADDETRALFVLYLARKQELLKFGDRSYENAFNHHGRDVVFETLAGVLGRLLHVHNPRNLPGLSSSLLNSPPREAEDSTEPVSRPSSGPGPRARYVLSRRIGGCRAPLSLDRVLTELVRTESPPEAELLPDLSRTWHEANPLSLDFFRAPRSPEERVLGEFILRRFARPSDLIRSDVLDRLLDARSDRKIQEFIAPRGADGPLFTVDYGEILFPELQFTPDEEHYRQRRRRHAAHLDEYLKGIQDLPADCLYRRQAGEVLARFASISDTFFQDYFARLSPRFFRYHDDSHRPALRPETLIDFFESMREQIRRTLNDLN